MYLQYTYARLNSVAKENDSKIQITESNASLVLELAKYSDVLQEVANETVPQKMSSYLVSLAREANSWYASNKIAGDQSNELLVYKIKTTLKSGLYILGIKTPERM